jgi:hypothetical protein
MMTVQETVARDTKSLIKFRKYAFVLYASPPFFGFLATWFAFKASRSLAGLSLEIAANIIVACFMLFFYTKMVAALDKSIERMGQPGALDEYAAWAGMTEAARGNIESDIKKKLNRVTAPLSIILNVLLFVSIAALIVNLIHLYFPHR